MIRLSRTGTKNESLFAPSASRAPTLGRGGMVRAELMGSRTHRTLDGIQVHVWQRRGKYLARGRYQGQAFGETLGDNVAEATARLGES